MRRRYVHEKFKETDPAREEKRREKRDAKVLESINFWSGRESFRVVASFSFLSLMVRLRSAGCLLPLFVIL